MRWIAWERRLFLCLWLFWFCSRTGPQAVQRRSVLVQSDFTSSFTHAGRVQLLESREGLVVNKRTWPLVICLMKYPANVEVGFSFSLCSASGGAVQIQHHISETGLNPLSSCCIKRLFWWVFLTQVRLPLLPVDFLTATVAKEDMIKTNLNCRDLLDEARNYHLQLSNKSVPDFEYSIRTTPRKHTAGQEIQPWFFCQSCVPLLCLTEISDRCVVLRRGTGRLRGPLPQHRVLLHQ